MNADRESPSKEETPVESERGNRKLRKKEGLGQQ
jgi:hypothetical protein